MKAFETTTGRRHIIIARSRRIANRVANNHSIRGVLREIESFTMDGLDGDDAKEYRPDDFAEGTVIYW